MISKFTAYFFAASLTLVVMAGEMKAQTQKTFKVSLLTPTQNIALGEILPVKIQIENISDKLESIPKELWWGDEVKIFIAKNDEEYQYYSGRFSMAPFATGREQEVLRPNQIKELEAEVFYNRKSDSVFTDEGKPKIRTNFAFQTEGYYRLKVVIRLQSRIEQLESLPVQIIATEPIEVGAKLWKLLQTNPLYGGCIQSGEIDIFQLHVNLPEMLADLKKLVSETQARDSLTIRRVIKYIEKVEANKDWKR